MKIREGGRWMYEFKGFLYYKKAIIFALVVALVLASIVSIFFMYEINREQQLRVIEATNQFVVFNSQVNTLIYSNINLLKGFVAYIQTHDTLYDENVYTYLDHLIKGQTEIINNVGIVKDTTIMWNYPFEENKLAIGVDLSQNEKQAPYVLAVKQTLKTTIQGPVDLVQGGRGYIIRSPVILPDGTYWGQVSIVLKADAFDHNIKTYEQDLNIQTIIRDGDQIIYGDLMLLDKDPIWFEFEDELLEWEIGVVPHSDVYYQAHRIIVIGISGVLFIISLSVTAYVLVRTNEKIRHESIHDPLTGLRNRNTLDESMAQMFAGANRNNHKAGVLLIDLNKFKSINDTYGHTAGDRVLIETAKRLKHVTRADEFVYRVGGDEFLVIMPHINPSDDFEAIKERFTEALTFQLKFQGSDLSIDSSIGCAIYPDDGMSFDALFQMADKRMYQDKKE